MTLPPTLRLFGREFCSFHVFGAAGLASAATITTLAALRSGLSLLVLALLFALACLTLYAVALLTRAICGEERLIYYHDEIAILLVSSATLAGLRLPVTPYLDVAVLGLGACVVCGRIGCAAVGCCYGRPTAWGWRYSAAHVKAGFPLALRGVPLVPVQLVESAGVLAITVGAAVILWRGAPQGQPLSLYLGGYALLRFALEFIRGDPARPRLRAWTEAQWTSLALLLLVLWNNFPWLAIAPALAAIAGLRKRPWPATRHILEIAAALREEPDESGVPVVVRTTPLGLRLSNSRLPDGSRIYALSSACGPMPERDAIRLLRVTALIEGWPPAEARILHGHSGVTAMVLVSRLDGGT